jgi:hypothetical protein
LFGTVRIDEDLISELLRVKWHVSSPLPGCYWHSFPLDPGCAGSVRRCHVAAVDRQGWRTSRVTRRLLVECDSRMLARRRVRASTTGYRG